MKAKDLLVFLKEFSEKDLEKEVTFYDFKNNIAYPTLQKPTVVDLSDEAYLDFCFNLTEDDL